MDSPTKHLRKGLVALFSAIATLATNAQEVDELQELEEVTFVSETDVTNVVPDIEIEGLFGPGLSPIETPRSISVISEEMMDRYGMESTRDFISAVPGTFTPSNYGIDGGLRIRGEDSETYFRGFRKLQNTALFPTPFGATDRVEIVRGAASVVHGPSRNSGYLNYVPKTARTDRAQIIEKAFGEATVTIGSDDRKNASFLYGVPFKTGETRSSALIYIEREDSESFYENDFDEYWIVQTGFDFTVNDKFKIEVGGMFFDWEGKNNVGWNRLTPELIEDGTYLSGQVPDINGFDGVIGPTLSAADYAIAAGNAPGPFSSGYNAFLFTPAGFFLGANSPFPPDDPNNPGESLWRIENPQLTKLDRDQTLVDQLDYAWVENITLYLDFVFEPTRDVTFKNQSFFDAYEYESYVSYGFSGYFDSYVFENRSSVEFEYDISETISSSHAAGVSVRYFDGLGRNAFGQGYQHADRRDLSTGSTPSDRSPNANNSDRGWSLDEETQYLDVGVYLASNFNLNDKLFLDTGLRWDYIDIDAKDSGVFAPGDESDTANEFTWNISLSTQIGAFRPYVTYAESVYLLVDSNGGTVAPANVANGTYLAEAELFEIGVKASFFDDKLYTALAYYDQENSRTDQFGSPIGIVSEGVELEARWAPTKKFSLTGAATWVQSTQTNDAFIRVPLSEVNRQLGTNIAPEDYYGGVTETTLSSIGRDIEDDVPGEPDYVLSLYGTYVFDSGFGATAGVTYVPEVAAGWFDDIILPDYYLVNATLFYTWENWTASLSIRNVLDEEYFSPQVFWDDLLTLPSEGRSFDLTLSYKW